MSKLGEKVNKILENIKANKETAFEQLFMTTYNHLKVVALNYLSNEADVEDVINETYLKVFKYINSANDEKDGYNWLCKIVQNVAYDFNKRNRVDIPINKIENNRLFYEIDESIFERNEVLLLIKSFEDIDQKLLYFKFWEDLSYDQIARKMSMKKSTVYKRVKSKLKQIEKNFEKKVNGTTSEGVDKSKK